MVAIVEVDANMSQELAEEWTRKLLTVLRIARQEEAKGRRLPSAMDLFVKHITGEATPVRDEEFNACLERSVMHAVRYLDGSSEWTEIAPGVNCKEVEDSTRELLEQMRALEISESSSGKLQEGTYMPLRTEPETAGMEILPGSGDKSGEGTVDKDSVPKGNPSSHSPERLVSEEESLACEAQDAGGFISETTGSRSLSEGREESSPRPPPRAMQEDSARPQPQPQLQSRPQPRPEPQPKPQPSQDPMASFTYSSNPPESFPAQTRPNTVPFAVPAYPLYPGRGYTLPVHAFYPMIPFVSTPSRTQDPRPPSLPFVRMCGYMGQAAAPVPPSTGAVFCAVPKLMLRPAGGLMYNPQYPGWCPGGSVPWCGYPAPPAAGRGSVELVDQPGTGSFAAVQQTARQPHTGRSHGSR